MSTRLRSRGGRAHVTRQPEQKHGMHAADQVPDLVALVARECVRPRDHDAFAGALLAHMLAGFGVDSLDSGRWEPPAATAARVREDHQQRALLAGLLRLELAACAPVLTEACGAPPIVLKGPAVARRLYSEVGLRPHMDLDLMVPRNRLRDAAAALKRERGFAMVRSERFFAADGEPWPGFTEKFGHELALTREASGRQLLVELHWRMSDDSLGSRLDHAELSGSAEPLPGLPPPSLAPAAADELILLAIHLLHHGSPLVLWCVDVGRARDALHGGEWLSAFERAHELGLSWALHAGLDRAAGVLGSDRRRPEPRPRRGRLGALRVAGLLPGGAGVHIGRMVDMPWRARAEYARRTAQAAWLRARSGP